MTPVEKLRNALIGVGFDFEDTGHVGLKCCECGGTSPRGVKSLEQWHRAVEHRPGCNVGDALSEAATEPLLYPVQTTIPAGGNPCLVVDFLGGVQLEIDQQTAEVTRAVYDWAWGTR